MWRAETLQPGLEFDIFKPRLKSGIFKCIFWLNGSFFGGDDRGFLKEVVKTYLMAPMSLLDSPTLFSVFSSIVRVLIMSASQQSVPDKKKIARWRLVMSVEALSRFLSRSASLWREEGHQLLPRHCRLQTSQRLPIIGLVGLMWLDILQKKRRSK
jgi:hypothetical protein